MKMLKQKICLSIVCMLGIGISLYTVILKLGGLSCFSINCGEVINSSYGSIVGIPVGLFAAVLWSLLFILSPKHHWIPKSFLIVASMMFISIQAFVLHRFCPVCMAHCTLCFILLFFKLNISIKRYMPLSLVGVLLTFLVVVGQEQYLHWKIKNSIPNLTSKVIRNGKQFPWLAEYISPESYLVVSMSCSHCKNIFKSIILQPSEKFEAPPLMILHRKNEPGVIEFVAAVLSRQDLSPANSFRQVYRQILKDTEFFFVGRNVNLDHQLLIAVSPNYREYLPEAKELLKAQQPRIKRWNVPRRPALVENGIVQPEKPTAQLLLQPI